MFYYYMIRILIMYLSLTKLVRRGLLFSTPRQRVQPPPIVHLSTRGGSMTWSPSRDIQLRRP